MNVNPFARDLGGERRDMGNEMKGRFFEFNLKPIRGGFPPPFQRDCGVTRKQPEGWGIVLLLMNRGNSWERVRGRD